ncbi:MAG TPA: PAS domain S-box protein [Pyrinomonadaceae bacterium]|nr:PAS domain S-box protein [Pyrinomonadaceae bacterium]
MRDAHSSSNGHEEDSVLIVNDVPEQLGLMDSLLRKAGYNVLTAGDGKEAFDIAKCIRPDVVISDVSMPRMNGMEFCRLIREDAALQTVPILLVSAHRRDTDSVVEGLASGADDYLEIPFDSTRLIAKVSRLVERSKTDAILRESQERYRLLFESIPQPIWVYDEETLAFLAVNEAAIKTYGYSREEFLSMTIEDIRSKEAVPALLVKTPTGDGEPMISSPWRHRRRDNSVIYVELTSHPLKFNGTRARLVIANDVSERKLLDEKQLNMHASVQQSAMEWRQTFNAMDFPVLIVDLEGHIRRCNQAAEEIAGLETEEILGRNLSEFANRQPWKKAAELIKQLGDHDGQTSSEVIDEFTNKTWIITLFLIHEFGSVGQRVIFIAQDITKRTQLEASLRQSEMMSLLGSLVAGVAHEVRNPLFGISSILDAFETRFNDRTEYLRYTNVLRDEVGRLTNLMEELLEYGKPFRGDLYLAPIDEVIAKSLRSCTPSAEVAQVNLVNDISQPLPKVMIDRRRLSKVFVNLIENAIQHSPSGSTVSFDARIVSEGGKSWIDCSVRDNGPGINDEDRVQIFEPFFSKRRGGTGLGLAIAKRIMDEHGGKLIAGNNQRGGACMTARFPAPEQEETVDG